jgi:hypothetical protein
VQRHGISRQLQPTASGSTPHNHVAIPQVCSSLSLPLDQPRQSAFRYPSDVANRPTTCAGRRHIPLIHRLLHRRAACWTDSIPFNQLTRGAQIPIAPAARPTSLTRGFLPWRLSDAGRRTRRVAPHAAGIRNPCMGRSLSRAIFILHISSLSHLFPPILLFGPAEPFFRPGRSFRGPSRAAAVKDGPVFGATASAARSVLDGCEHDGKMRRLGATHFASLVRESASVGRGIAEPPV